MREKICITILRRQLEELKECVEALGSPEELKTAIREYEEAVDRAEKEYFQQKDCLMRPLPDWGEGFCFKNALRTQKYHLS